MQAVLQKITENGGAFVLCTLNKDRSIFFAIDNVDLKINATDGKRQQYGTGTAFYQHKSMEQKGYENPKPELKQISGRRVLNHSLHQ